VTFLQGSSLYLFDLGLFIQFNQRHHHGSDWVKTKENS